MCVRLRGCGRFTIARMISLSVCIKRDCGFISFDSKYSLMQILVTEEITIRGLAFTNPELGPKMNFKDTCKLDWH